jgi:hypothetical protein
MTGLRPLHADNSFSSYADDGYLLIPSVSSHTIASEIDNLRLWASSVNLSLNVSKTKEIIFSRPSFDHSLLPPPTPLVERVQALTILGVSFNNRLSFSLHVDNLLTKGHQRLYALKTLKSHGLSHPSLTNVTRSILFSVLTYASPAWWGFITQSDIQRLNSLLNKAKKWDLFQGTIPSFQSLCQYLDDSLFQSIIQNPNHSLYHLLPPLKPRHYNLRASQTHDRTLPDNSTALLSKNFIVRKFYSSFH